MIREYFAFQISSQKRNWKEVPCDYQNGKFQYRSDLDWNNIKIGTNHRHVSYLFKNIDKWLRKFRYYLIVQGWGHNGNWMKREIGYWKIEVLIYNFVNNLAGRPFLSRFQWPRFTRFWRGVSPSTLPHPLLWSMHPWECHAATSVAL